jgi:hypothetical protein
MNRGIFDDVTQDLARLDPREPELESSPEEPPDDCDVRRFNERATVAASGLRRKRRVPLGSWAAMNNAACNGW